MLDPAARYTLPFSVSPDDVDVLGHASNIAYVRWLQEAATAHSSHVGWDYARYLELGGVFVVRRHEIDYLRPAYGGEPLQLITWVERFRAATSLRHTEVRREADGEVLARGKTTWALVDVRSGRPMRIPPELRDAFPVH